MDYAAFYRKLAPVATAMASVVERAPAGYVEGMGSNNWVVSGAHTVTGKPLLANDPHLGLQAPSLWYFAQMQAPGLDVTGATLPGIPLVVLGHNARIAWGFTNTAPDVQDLYIERIDPAHPTRYQNAGRLGGVRDPHRNHPREGRPGREPDRPGHPARPGPVRCGRAADHRRQAAGRPVRGGVPVDRAAPGRQDLRRRPEAGRRARLEHLPGGDARPPRAAAEYRLCRCGRQYRLYRAGPGAAAPGGQRPEGPGAGAGLGCALRLDRLRAVRRAAAPLQSAGRHDRDGQPEDRGRRLPVLHHQRVDGAVPPRPHPRAAGGHPAPYAGHLRGHPEGRALLAVRDALPLLLAAPVARDAKRPDRERALFDALRKWDATMAADRAEPLVATAWLRELSRLLFEDKLDATQFNRLWDQRNVQLPMLNALRAPNGAGAFWCDNTRTPTRETCAETIGLAWQRAMADLDARYGSNPEKWRWGRAHTARAEHKPFGKVSYLSGFLTCACRPAVIRIGGRRPAQPA